MHSFLFFKEGSGILTLFFVDSEGFLRFALKFHLGFRIQFQAEQSHPPLRRTDSQVVAILQPLFVAVFYS